MVEKLFWVENIEAHVEEDFISVPVKSIYLENIIAIQFEITYDQNILSLNIENCNGDNNSDCELTNPNLSYFTNSLTEGIIQGIIYSAIPFNINNELLNINFDITNAVAGNSSYINFNVFEINDIDIFEYTQNGFVTIGNFGCTDEQACNYNLEATYDDGSCAYELDCFGECGGDAVLDCNEDCCNYINGPECVILDCFGECGGEGVEDICGICGGNTIENSDGSYIINNELVCDCEGTSPQFIYCVDSDGDGFGNPNYSFEFCSDINENHNSNLVQDCSDENDDCVEEFDSCGICGGFGPDSITNCCSNTGLSILGIPPDDCGNCGGNMFINDNGFYPDNSCDCDGTSPESYCTDVDNNGVPDSDPIFFCYEPSSDFFINCESLAVKDTKLNDFKLFSVYPNPFNPSITIKYELDKIEIVKINILDINGRYIQNLVSSIQTPGQYSINWSPVKSISSGIYLLEFKYDNKIFIEKINYIK